MNLVVYAPAKINWHLQVGSRRNDGYHPIFSVFQKTDLCDVLHIDLKESGCSSVSVSGLENVAESGVTTLDKAFLLWSEKKKKKYEVNVRIEKNIPTQSGLGGGSSDAASFILALERMTDNTLCYDEIFRTGLEVGSDVPFFLSQCDAAVVSGRGEIIKPIEARYDLCGYILVPEAEKMSTAAAYAMLDKRKTVKAFRTESEIEKMYRKAVSEWNFENDFELVNLPSSLPVRTFLTGSGSCRILLKNDLESYFKSYERAYCDAAVSECIGNTYTKIGFTTCKTSYFRT